MTLEQYRGCRVGIVGLGRSGRAAAAALRAGGAEVIGWDDSQSAADAATASGIVVAGPTDFSPVRGLAKLVVSPGVPHLFPAPHPVVRAALDEGVALDNDVGLLFEAVPEQVRVVAVTGSNGKSTTTALIGHILRAVGRTVNVAGNIGEPVLGVDLSAADYLVLELSSYQIELARRLRPEVGVFLNFSDDHLDRHGGRGGYFAAKARLFETGRPRVAVIGVDETEGAVLHNQLRQRPGGPEDVIAVCASATLGNRVPSIRVEGTSIVEHGRQAVIAQMDVRGAVALQGPHNVRNTAAAYGVCRGLGVTADEFLAALATFPGLPHRFELLGRHAGVVYVNDSKATNPAATAEALAAVKRTRWIAGGRAKAGALTPLAPWLGHVVKAYFIGESAEQFATAFHQLPHEIAGTLEAAATHAMAEAQVGETVLLSPACASFDQFADFAARGDAFRELVASHMGACR